MTDPRRQLEALVPFIRTLGISVDRIAPGEAAASLASRPEIHNHLGTLHAGAVYTLAETASGGVVLSIFGDLMARGLFVALKEARVVHHRAAPGDATAEARGARPAGEVRAAYERDGRVDFDVEVAVRIGEVHHATVTLTWAVRAPREG